MRQNPTFFGRDNELKCLQEVLDPDRSSTTLRCVCLYGFAGTGKSQVALEYAYRHSKDYDLIFWIAAETSLKLNQSFACISDALGISENPAPSANNQREKIMHWLATAKGF